MTALKKALTIAGSDTSGGAGMQADLKTFQEYGVYGMTALTCVVTMSPKDWSHTVYPFELSWVEDQLHTVFDCVGIDAMKTGMLASTDLVGLIAREIDRHDVTRAVIDPVMVCKGVDKVMIPDVALAIRDTLVSRAAVVTPNVVEAAILASMDAITNIDEMKEAASRIIALGAKSVVIKGGDRMSKSVATDLFYDGREFEIFENPVFPDAFNHGAGCTFSAAVTAGLAKGMTPLESVRLAKRFITEALRTSFRLTRFGGATNHTAFRSIGA